MDKELKEDSKKILKQKISKRMTTIMIGSIAILEDELKNSSDVKLRNLFENMRQRILDLGNNQIRNINDELNSYDVESNRYVLKMGTLGKGNLNE